MWLGVQGPPVMLFLSFPVSSLCHYHDITIRRQSSSVTDCYGGTNTGQGEPRNPIKSIPPSFRQCCQYSSQKGLIDPVSQLCGVIPLSWDPRCVQISDTIFTLLIFFYNPYQVTFIAAYIYIPCPPPPALFPAKHTNQVEKPTVKHYCTLCLC